MSLFSSKSKIGSMEYSRWYYDNFFLNQMEEEKADHDKTVEGLRISIIEKDKRFKKVTKEKFLKEFIPLQFEIFALVWLHKYGDKSAVAQSMFTKEYFREKQLESIWLGMERYNKSIIRSSVIGLDKTQIALNNKKKADIADTYIKFFQANNIEIDERVGRTINRLFTEIAWANRVTPSFLMLAFIDVLEIEKDFHPTEEGQIFLITILIGIYDIISESLSKIKIVN